MARRRLSPSPATTATTTGADGKLQLRDVPAGNYSVFASAYRHLPYYTEFEAQEESDAQRAGDRVRQHPVGSVEGTITTESGDPVDEVLVTCTQPNVDPFTYTDENGHYRIDNVPPATGSSAVTSRASSPSAKTP